MPCVQALGSLPDDSIKKSNGPAILMERKHHLETASNSHHGDSIEYRAKQAELLSQGKFDEAFQNDIDDIRQRFGDKYDEAIRQAEEYRKTLDI